MRADRKSIEGAECPLLDVEKISNEVLQRVGLRKAYCEHNFYGLRLILFHREPCPRAQLFRLAFQLPAGSQYISPAGSAHRTRIAGVEHNV